MRTISSHREIDRLFSEGRRVSHPALLVLAAPTASPDGAGRLLFVAGKRLGGAVTRNRSKRVLREAARRASAPWAGWDVAFIARDATPTAAPGTLDAAIARALSMLGIES